MTPVVHKWNNGGEPGYKEAWMIRMKKMKSLAGLFDVMVRVWDVSLIAYLLRGCHLDRYFSERRIWYCLNRAGDRFSSGSRWSFCFLATGFYSVSFPYDVFSLGLFQPCTAVVKNLTWAVYFLHCQGLCCVHPSVPFDCQPDCLWCDYVYLRGHDNAQVVVHSLVT